MNIFVKDKLRQTTEVLSGGKETVLYDSFGVPNIMSIIPKFKIKNLDTTRIPISSYNFSSSQPYIVINNYENDNFSNSLNILSSKIFYLKIYNFYENGENEEGFIRIYPSETININTQSVTIHKVEYLTIDNSFPEVSSGHYPIRILDSNHIILGEITALPKTMNAANEMYNYIYDSTTGWEFDSTSSETDEINNSVSEETHPAFIKNGIELDEIFIGKYRSRSISNESPSSYYLNGKMSQNFSTIPNTCTSIERLLPTITAKGEGWHIMNIWEHALIHTLYTENFNIFTKSTSNAIQRTFPNIEELIVYNEYNEYGYPYLPYIPELIDGIGLNARSEFNITPSNNCAPRLFEFIKDNRIGYDNNNESYDIDSEDWIRDCLVGLTELSNEQKLSTHNNYVNLRKISPSTETNPKYNSLKNIERDSNYNQETPKEYKKYLMLLGIDAELDRIANRTNYRRIGFYNDYLITGSENDDTKYEDYIRSVCLSGFILPRSEQSYIGSKLSIDPSMDFDITKGFFRNNPLDLFFGFLNKRDFDIHYRVCYS
jgi:hypothetical protein